jgi:hypothetical protein
VAAPENFAEANAFLPRLTELRRNRPLVIALAAAALIAVAVPVGFALFTGQVWEDFLITYRHSRNLAEGHGLVYEVGERVHGFTSPLNVLLPALWQWLVPSEDFHPALWFFNTVGLAVLALGFVTLGWWCWRGPRERRWVICAVPLIALLQAKTCAFAVNGQETALLAGFLLLGQCAALRGFATHWRAAGLAWAGLMWTRPDSPVYVAALALAGLAFNGRPRRAEWRGLGCAALVCAALYAPWFAWASWYYGSPVPHTIQAKFNPFANSLAPGATLQRLAAQWPVAISRAFEPVYAEAGSWPAWLGVWSHVLGGACAAYWLVPVRDPLGRVASLVFLCGSVYLTWIGAVGFIFPWYFTPLGVCGAIVLAAGAAALGERWRAPRAAVLALLVVLAPEAWLFGESLALVRVQQREIEDGTRRQVGLWLRRHSAPGATVYLEPIGYIGYFSERHILDWPGLVSPRVLQARREQHTNFFTTVSVLRPDWLVLRSRELATAQSDAFIAANYEVAAEIDSRPRLAGWGGRPGAAYLFSDARFFLLKRR